MLIKNNELVIFPNNNESFCTLFTSATFKDKLEEIEPGKSKNSEGKAIKCKMKEMYKN